MMDKISDYVKKILNIDKCGHSGTLDPHVTGVLPIALGRATRLTNVLLTAGKEYICLMHLHKKIAEPVIKRSFNEFIGKVQQMPPLKSAVKRQLREREVYYIHILETKGQDILFKIGCQAGTYIRKICHDYGKLVGAGAHMAELIRTKAGPFNSSNWITLHDLKDAFELYKEGNEAPIRKVILNVEAGIEHIPKIWVLDSAVDSLCHGANLSMPGISRLHSGINANDAVAVMTLKDELICLGKARLSTQGMLQNDREIAVSTTKVFMERLIYPTFKK